MEMLSLLEMTQQERDEYLVYASAKICRGAGVDMPDEVAEQHMFFSERMPGYELDLLDTVFNCLAFTLAPRDLADKEKQAMQEMLKIDCEDEDVTNGIIMQLITYSNYAAMNKVPRIK